jgi:hypothetical protein
MPPIKRVLKHLIVETAAKKRKCHRDADHEITKGTKSLAVYDDQNRRNYCVECAQPILEQAQSDLDAVIAQLNS